jgi:hypothetical protein
VRGWTLKSLAAKAARAATKRRALANVAPPPGNVDGVRHDQPQQAGEQARQAREEPWAPPDQVATADRTTQALRAALPRLQAFTAQHRPAAGQQVMNQAAMRQDLEQVRRGQQMRAGNLAIAGRDVRNPNAVVPVNQPCPPGNDLTVQRRDVANPLPITPVWHDAKNLPGYVAGGMTRMARRLRV